MSSFGRENPFQGAFEESGEATISQNLTGWIWNLDGRIEGGGKLSFEAFAHRPGVYRPLLSALWSTHVACIPPATFNSVRGFRHYFRMLESFITSHPDSNVSEMTSLMIISRQFLIDYRFWATENYSSNVSRKGYRGLVTLLLKLRSAESPIPGMLANDLEIPTKALQNRRDAEEYRPFTSDEERAIEAACKKAIRAVVERLNRGKGLLLEGVDPRISGVYVKDNTRYTTYSTAWESVPNILWYIVNVLKGRMPNSAHESGAVEPLYRFLLISPRAPIKKLDAFDLLYPNTFDLLPFVILFSLKTGLNFESIISLRRDCLQGTEGGMTFVRYAKERGRYEEMIRGFSNQGAFSPVGLIMTVLDLTESLVELADPVEINRLWLGHHLVKGQRNGEANGQYSNRASVFDRVRIRARINGSGGFMGKHKILDRNGQILTFNFSVARKTNITNKYLKHGNLENISRNALKHHGPQALNTTVLHYLANDATEHVHSAAVRSAQEKVVAEARRVIVMNDLSASEIISTAKTLSISQQKFESIIKGEQDVFIASCKDFFNKPEGKPNTPCDEVWNCFSCPNALWTSRIVPRLFKFLEFLEEQRKFLGPDEWNKKFGLPYLAITKDIVPRFDLHTINWAKAQALDLPFYVPPNLKES